MYKKEKKRRKKEKKKMIIKQVTRDGELRLWNIYIVWIQMTNDATENRIYREGKYY